MILSQLCKYAIQAVLFIAKQKPGQFIPIKKVAGGRRNGYILSFSGENPANSDEEWHIKFIQGTHGEVCLVYPANEVSLL